jgi:hypothetical protein
MTLHELVGDPRNWLALVGLVAMLYGGVWVIRRVIRSLIHWPKRSYTREYVSRRDW